jgi:hypothetical protein
LNHAVEEVVVKLLAVVLASIMVAPAAAQDAAFRPLLEWQAAGGGALPDTWQIEGDTIRHQPGGGDIESLETFGDFELAFDWRIAPGGNSGVAYRVGDGTGAAFERGPEYQILDNPGHPDGQNPLTSAGSVYALYPPSADVTRPAGEWNSGRIVVDGTHVEHWLNDVRIVEYELGSPDWTQRVAASKFVAWPQFGKARTGHIVLQDHASVVEYRSVRVRLLP